MAIVTTSLALTGTRSSQWAVPTDDVLRNSAVPRAIYSHSGSSAIAAKLAADQSRVVVTLDFEAPYCYLLKSISCLLESADDVMDFDAVGSVGYDIPNVDPSFEIESKAVTRAGSTLTARRTYVATGDSFIQRLIDGDRDGMSISLADVSADASSACSVFIRTEFYEFDKEQCLNWPVHTPTRTVLA